MKPVKRPKKDPANLTMSAQHPEAQHSRTIRPDLQLIADMIDDGSRVLDIGCGDGLLLSYLVEEKGVIGRGMELSQEGVNASVTQGLSVVQGDADSDLNTYPEGGFDYVVLSKTLQATRDPRAVLRQLVRIGSYAVVSFPNFGYWRIRLSLMFNGRMPDTPLLPEPWYETPNIHLCTIRDFVELCMACGVVIEEAYTVGAALRPRPIRSLHTANLCGQDGVFLLRKA
ncbi:methionine biosynthesis protein MetW [Fodinicurvata sediminis]|uniref:methionine biosynthesis protein MetW n=1 Tax=Fodinicurvata sediminis TaxID=1121832 RepID=UPI000429FA09|nr:methionine biosynthesis protein MetW [Fodinicurvata sediminis]